MEWFRVQDGMGDESSKERHVSVWALIDNNDTALKVSRKIELLEESEFESNKSTEDYRWSMKVSKFYANLIGTSVDKLTEDRNDPIVNERFFCIKPQARLSDRAKSGYRMLRIWYHYIAFKFAWIVGLQYRHDRLIELWTLLMQPGAFTYLDGKCAIVGEMIEYTRDVPKRLELIQHWLNIFGGSMLTITGTNAIEANYALIFSLLYPIGSFHYLRYRQLRANILAFIQNPQLESKRVRLDLESLALELAIASSEYNAIHLHHSVDVTPEDAEQQVDNDWHSKFIWSLRSVCQSKANRPTNLTSVWHKRLTQIFSRALTLCLFVGSLYTIVIITLMIVIESYNRAKYRLDKMICKNLTSNGTLLREQFYPLAGLEYPQERFLYEANIVDNSYTVSSAIYLGLFVELKHWMTFWKSVTILEYLAVVVTNMMMLSLYTCIFVLGVLDKLLWLTQIDRQLKSFNEQLELTYKLEEDTNKYNEELIEKALAGYLNLRLFKKRYELFRNLSNQLITIAFMYSAELLLLSTLVLTKMTAKSHLIIIQGTFKFIIVTSIYLFSAAYLLTRITRTRGLMDLIMINFMRFRLSCDSVSINFMGEMFCKQLTFRKEMGPKFAIRLFSTYGPSVTMGLITGFFLQMFALYTYLLRHL